MSSAAASAQPTAALAAVPPPTRPAPAHGAPLPPPQLLDVLCALYRSVHPEFALLVGLSSDFYHDAGLLAATATVVSTRRGATRLRAAVERSDVPRATELLAACPTPAATVTLLEGDSNGHSVLMYAVSPAMAQLLLRVGANPQAVDNDGRDALADAAERGKLGVFRTLAAALPDGARRLAATALLRRAVHMSNVWHRACHYNIHRLFDDGDGEGFDYVNWCGLGHAPAGLQEACIPFAQASTHRFMQKLEGIRELQLLSDGELAALVTPSDESTLREFYRGEFSYHASILGGGGVLSSDNATLHRRRWPRSFQDSWIAACAIPLQAALFALDAGAPIDTRVPARMGPLDEVEYDASDHSRDEPMREWLAMHSEWFGLPLVAAALARWT